MALRDRLEPCINESDLFEADLFVAWFRDKFLSNLVEHCDKSDAG